MAHDSISSLFNCISLLRGSLWYECCGHQVTWRITKVFLSLRGSTAGTLVTRHTPYDRIDLVGSCDGSGCLCGTAEVS